MYHRPQRDKKNPAFAGLSLDNLRFLEGGKCAILLNRLEALHREVDNDGLRELGYVNTPFLEVGLAADLARRVKLRRADAV